jgi:alkanesulfonate monooxygenase SsuD/methylene tetrahydromethanopterin reductase-like flavin-dependent oxidoreductase (luciferase family)
MPILIGGDGEKVTLRLVAEHADMWNGFGPPDAWARRSGVLDEWCAKVGRDPSAIERTVLMQPDDVRDAPAFVEAGASHLIVEIGAPFDLAPAEQLLVIRGRP